MDYEGAIKHITERLEKELASHLHYHGGDHTKDVLEATERIGKYLKVAKSELSLLLVAAAYHDCGFLVGHVEHEAAGCEIARTTLPKFGFAEKEIERICEMIMATKIPQSPKNHLSEILCDADLDYLGRDDFDLIAYSLFNELKQLGIVDNIETWNRIQVNFLNQHHYHTEYGKTERQPKKRIHLDKIKVIVAGYDD
jgi:predicted metal-dependent HD superfamily phosphohydrolase